MDTFTFPDSQALRLIEQEKLPRLTAARPIFEIFPQEEQDDWIISWEQYDKFVGLQGVRGLNGAPSPVKHIGSKRFTEEPGVYGEFVNLDEKELTRRRKLGTFDQAIDLSDLVVMAQDDLLQRRLDRIEAIGWTLLATGTFSVAGESGAILYTSQYTPQSFTANIGWGTSSTAHPLADLRTIKLKARGFSVRFDAGAKLYLNQVTANKLFTNLNPADLYGRRTSGFGTINSPAQLNELLAGDDLPAIVVYDEGWIDENGDYQLFIPDDTAILVGVRTNAQPAGGYIMSRNVNNPGFAAGAYTKVIDKGETQVPRSFEVHDGHNGAIAMRFPSSIVQIDTVN